MVVCTIYGKELTTNENRTEFYIDGKTFKTLDEALDYGICN